MIKRLLCWLGRHSYVPSYLTRTKRKRGLGTVKEFCYECKRCGQSTGWMRWSTKAAFDKQHHPSWGKP